MDFIFCRFIFRNFNEHYFNNCSTNLPSTSIKNNRAKQGFLKIPENWEFLDIHFNWYF
jgi:hypothetical protein